MAVAFAALSLGLYRALQSNEGQEVAGLTLSGDGATLAIAYRDGSVYLVNTSSRRVIGKYAHTMSSGFASLPQRAVALSDDGKLLGVHEEPLGNAAKGEVIIVDVESGTRTHAIAVPPCGTPRILRTFNVSRRMAFSPDGQQLAVACSTGGLIVINTFAGTSKAFPFGIGRDEFVDGVQFFGDGRQLAIHGFLGIRSFKSPITEFAIVDTALGTSKESFKALLGLTGFADKSAHENAQLTASASVADLTANYDEQIVTLSTSTTGQPIGEPISCRWNRRVPLPAVIVGSCVWLAVLGWTAIARLAAWRAARLDAIVSPSDDVSIVTVAEKL